MVDVLQTTFELLTIDELQKQTTNWTQFDVDGKIKSQKKNIFHFQQRQNISHYLAVNLIDIALSASSAY